MTEQDKRYSYVKAPNGWTVRIPSDHLPQWEQSQEALKSGKLDSSKEAQALNEFIAGLK